MTEEPTPTWPETLSRASAALMPGPLGGAAAIVVDDVIARHRAKAEQFVAVVTAGTDEQTLRARMSIDRVGTVVSNACEAAVNSSVNAKRRALARVARNAIDDDAKLDESEIVVQTLSRLETPHIATLARLGAVDERLETGVEGDLGPGVYAEQQDAFHKAVQKVANREHFAVLAVLHSLGLLLPPPGITGGSSAQWVGGLSELGLSLLAYLSDLDDSSARGQA